MEREELVVYVHGGVTGSGKAIPSLAYAIAASSGMSSALDAVEGAVRALEDDPALNAGYGSALTMDGKLELDAGICDGSTGATGAVTAVQVKNPITLARLVMEKTPHRLMVGEGAMQLDRSMERLSQTSPEQLERWQKAKTDGHLTLDRFGAPERADTVGAIALDAAGRLAAGSSTGGVFGQLPGRVGDAPIFGAGFYASSAAAVVGTGIGEVFIETSAALRAGWAIDNGNDPQTACEQALEVISARGDYTAGLLALDATGTFGAAFIGRSMPVAGPDGDLEPRRIG